MTKSEISLDTEREISYARFTQHQLRSLLKHAHQGEEGKKRKEEQTCVQETLHVQGSTVTNKKQETHKTRLLSP